MKMHFVLTTLAICVWSCANGTKNAPERVVVNNIAGEPGMVSTDPSPTPKSGPIARAAISDQRIDTYVDGKLESTSVYRDGRLVKDLIYNTDTKELTTEIEYFYKKNGELDHQKVVRGKYYDDSEEGVLERKQAEKDFKVQYDLLKSKGIEFPLPDIASDEVSDLSNILSVADNYNDFKREIQTNGNQRVIKFVGFNKNIRFQPSVTTLVAGNNPIQIKDFELTLENDFPTKEILNTNDGELTKTYSYKDGKLIRVIYQFTDLENRINSLEKRFEYHELK